MRTLTRKGAEHYSDSSLHAILVSRSEIELRGHVSRYTPRADDRPQPPARPGAAAGAPRAHHDTAVTSRRSVGTPEPWFVVRFRLDRGPLIDIVIRRR